MQNVIGTARNRQGEAAQGLVAVPWGAVECVESVNRRAEDRNGGNVACVGLLRLARRALCCACCARRQEVFVAILWKRVRRYGQHFLAKKSPTAGLLKGAKKNPQHHWRTVTVLLTVFHNKAYLYFRPWDSSSGCTFVRGTETFFFAHFDLTTGTP